MSERRERKKGRKGEEVEHVVTINKCIYMYMDMVTKDIPHFSFGRHNTTFLWHSNLTTHSHRGIHDWDKSANVLLSNIHGVHATQHNRTPTRPPPPHAPPPHTCLPRPLLTQQRVLGHQPSCLHGCLQLAPGVEAPQASYGVLTVHCGRHTVPVLKGGRGTVEKGGRKKQ